MIKKFLTLFFIVSLCLGCSIRSQLILDDLVPNQIVRVAVLEQAKEFSLNVKGPFSIFDFSKNLVLRQDQSFHPSIVFVKDAGIQIGNDYYDSRYLRITPYYDASIYIDGLRFRGRVDIVRNNDDLLTVVNVISLEKYIKGVLYREISDRWPLEAIKAQAVAARTYAVYIKERNKKQIYDLRSDIYSQVYGGKSAERYRTNLAVDRTKGLILRYDGEVLPAYYHATCAGKTENVKELWDHDIVPLRGVTCKFCRKSPHYFWKKNIQLKDIQDKLNLNGYNLWLIQEIQVVDRNQSGRINKLKIITRDNKEVIISGKDFRQIVGPNLIKSNNYIIDMQGYYVNFIGKGWGHGVGLCQWGANFMARNFYQFDEILHYYYPGSNIVEYK
ncbi:MAG: SpoIID/LytB domain-containing protein [Candidatus Omnitrophica bacterium]|nr:SpoIID/LytB domain-containing protein [Candidatus Omnitrophota bacterium]